MDNALSLPLEKVCFYAVYWNHKRPKERDFMNTVLLYRQNVCQTEFSAKVLCCEEYKDGYMTIPDKPGLGIEINEEECLKHPYTPHTLRHYTGALTDIRPAKTEFYF